MSLSHVHASTAYIGYMNMMKIINSNDKTTEPLSNGCDLYRAQMCFPWCNNSASAIFIQLFTVIIVYIFVCYLLKIKNYYHYIQLN